jgi:hypothetical protein
VTDDELQDKLRRLTARPAADWDAMAAAVRDGYDRALVQRRATVRRRRWAGTAGGALAMAAAFALYLHAHPAPPPHAPALEPGDSFSVFEDPEPGELLEELTPAEVDRVAKAFDHKGA